MILSIIVPAYNVENYIKRCLDSLINQNIKIEDYEIVIVDDGSTDKSSKIIDEYANIYPQIKVIHKENGGLSSARNTGIENASGEYLMFVDSDDYIAKDCLQGLLHFIISHKLEYLGYGIKVIKNGHESNYFQNNIFPDDKIITGQEYLANYAPTITSCGHIVKKSIYIKNSLRFIDGIINEDYDFMLRLYSVLHRMSFLNIPVYYYDLKNAGSITSTKTETQYLKSINSWIVTISSLNNWINRLPKDKAELRNYMRLWIDNFKYRAVVNLIKSKMILRKKYEFLSKYKSLGILSYSTRTLKGRRKIIGHLLRNQFIATFLIYIHK